MNNLPAKLTKLRKHYNYSQGNLAELLGVDTIEYMGYENGRKMISYAQMKKLAGFYHIDVADMFRNSDDVKLYDVSSTNTDELNIAYFIPRRTPLQKFLSLCRKYKFLILAAVLVLVVAAGILTSVNRNRKIPYEATQRNSYRLSVSETSVVYIDNNGAVLSSGDNSNGQLTGLPESSAIKAAEGSTFTIVLDDQGKLTSYGLMEKYAEEISSWDRITDVAAGDGHIIAVDDRGKIYCAGDNSYGQCDISSSSDVTKVFASSRGSMAVGSDGKLFLSGEFIGSSMVKYYSGLQDIDCSEDNTVILMEDGKVNTFAKTKTFMDAENWTDIVDVACGNEFIAGLDSTGKVHIDIDNYIISKEVDSWENIIAIDSGNDYLIAFDGSKIMGIGKDAYHQFEKSSSLKTNLTQVPKISLRFEEEYVCIDFDPVANASGYLVSVDAGIGLSQFVETDVTVRFAASSFEDGKDYTLTIVTKGEDDYEDSQPLVYTFTYTAYQPEPEEKFTVDDLIGKTRTNFEAYLRGLGYDMNKLQATETEEICTGEEAIVTGVSGLYEKESISVPEFQSRQISYSYCKLEVEHGEE